MLIFYYKNLINIIFNHTYINYTYKISLIYIYYKFCEGCTNVSTEHGNHLHNAFSLVKMINGKMKVFFLIYHKPYRNINEALPY